MFFSIARSMVDIKQYKIINKISKGGYGEIYKVEHVKSKKKYAAKIMTYNMEDKISEKMIDREVTIMLSYTNPTLVKIYGFSLIDLHNEPNVTLIMELAQNGSLADLLRAIRSALGPPEYDNTYRQIILIGISRGMKYLHDHFIIHRDLSTSNVLLNENLQPIITDFGLSKFIESGFPKNQSIYGGKHQYMAPEIIVFQPYDFKVDVYAFGIVMYEVVMDLVPYPEFEAGKISDYELKDKVVRMNYRPIFSKPIKKSIRSLIERCWSPDPEDRPTFREIFQKLAKKDSDCILNNVDYQKVEEYVSSISDATDFYEKLNEKVESIGKGKEKIIEKPLTNKISELKNFKKETKIDIKKLRSEKERLKEIEQEQCLKNGSFNQDDNSIELLYPSKTFSELYNYAIDQKEIENNKKQIKISIVISGINETDQNFVNNENIDEVTIEPSVKAIGNESFKGCTSLTQVVIPTSVTKIKNNSFFGCKSLKRVFIPSSVKNIGKGAFKGCTELKLITLPSTIKIESNAFEGCNKLNKIINNDLNPYIDINDYQIVGCLEKDVNNCLFKVKNIKTGKKFALKAFNETFDIENNIEYFIKTNITCNDIPGIVKVESFRVPSITPKSNENVNKDFDLSGFLFITKFMKYGNIGNLLKEYLSSNGQKSDKMNPTIRSKIIFGVACTMKQLHNRKIIHNNLNKKTVFLDDKLEPKVGSFYLYDFMNNKDDIKKTQKQQQQNLNINTDFLFFEKCSNDVYDYGVLLYLMFKIRKPIDIQKMVEQDSERTSAIPHHYLQLIRRCLDPERYQRPSFDQITTLLKDDKYALEEFGMKTDLSELHEYQQRIDNDF